MPLTAICWGVRKMYQHFSMPHIQASSPSTGSFVGLPKTREHDKDDVLWGSHNEITISTRDYQAQGHMA